MDNGAIKLEGLDQVLKALDDTTPLVKQAVMQGLEKGGLDIIADAQNDLRNNGSVVTGLLRQSGKVQKTDESTIDAGFFDTTNRSSGYAFFVEYGRRAGKMPPPGRQSSSLCRMGPGKENSQTRHQTASVLQACCRAEQKEDNAARAGRAKGKDEIDNDRGKRI